MDEEKNGITFTALAQDLVFQGNREMTLKMNYFGSFWKLNIILVEVI